MHNSLHQPFSSIQNCDILVQVINSIHREERQDALSQEYNISQWYGERSVAELLRPAQ